MKPRILVFTTAYHPFIGGAEIAIQEIAERLKDRFDFYIITSRFRRDLPRREKRPEGTVIRLGFGTILDKWLLVFLAPFCTELRSVRYRSKFGTMFWGVDISTGSLAAAVFKIFHPRTPFVFNIQYGYGDDQLANGRLGLIGLALRFILSRADFVTTISSYLLDTARSYGYKGPAEVIHNGVDIEMFKSKESSVKGQMSNVVITTSRLVPKNGVDILIKAVAEVKKKMPNIQCWILGDGPESTNLKLQVESLKMTENVKFFGSVPYDNLPQYLHQADIFVRASRSEGMGNSFVEALAAGLPIIGTPVGGLTDIIKDGKTGLFARVDDPKDLAEKIIRLLSDHGLAESIVQEGKRAVEKQFLWNDIARRYSRVFGNYYRGRTSIVRPFRILIATPLFPPQIGGPALYAKNLGEEFEKLDYDVRMASFTSFLRYPSGISHLLYFLLLLYRGWKSEVIFALDYTSVGLPAAVASLLLRRPLVIRVEGDFLWESFVQRSRKDVTLTQFYQVPQFLTRKERLVRKVSGWVMRRAHRLVFSSEWRRSIVINAYRTRQEKTAIIQNVWPSTINLQPTTYNLQPKVILWAGRMLYLKNLYRLIRSFAHTSDGSWQLHLVGDGPERKRLEDFVKIEKIRDVHFFQTLSREKLLDKMAESVFFILPSLSEVGPNVIAEALFTQTPFIMSKESGYREYFADWGFLVDPLSEKDIESKMKILMDEDTRRIYKKKLRDVPLNRSWAEAAGEWVYLFQPFFSARTR